MRSVTVVAAALIVSVAGLAAAQTPVPTAPKSLVWADLFAPPYNGLPEVSMSIGCADPHLCMFPGGTQNQGFMMFEFDGQPNGYVMPMAQPNTTVMIMAATIAGTKANPVGAFAGTGIATLSFPYQYLVNGTTWLPSLAPPNFISATKSIRSTDDGAHILAIGSPLTGSAVWHSIDGGKSYSEIPIKLPVVDVNCTDAMYAAMADNHTWYVTFGSEPGSNSYSNSNSDSSSSFGATLLARESFTSTIVRNEDGKMERVMHSAFEGHKARASKTEMCPGYTGQIAKSTDGGNTWTNLVFESEYSFAQIDCASPTHCLAVAYGVVGGQTVSMVFLTTDGKTFQKVYSLTSTAATSYGFQTVRFVDAHEAWIGGSVSIGESNYGGLWFTKDGGNTWQQYQELQPNIVMIFDLVFTKGVGFAIALTELKIATVLRYKKQYFDGYFVQSNCPFANCTFACQNMSFPQGLCMQAQGGSVQAFCDDNEIVSQQYQTTSCVGAFTVATMPINTCINSTSGGFFENFCLPKSQGASIPPRARTTMRRH